MTIITSKRIQGDREQPANQDIEYIMCDVCERTDEDGLGMRETKHLASGTLHICQSCDHHKRLRWVADVIAKGDLLEYATEDEARRFNVLISMVFLHDTKADDFSDLFSKQEWRAAHMLELEKLVDKIAQNIEE